MCDNPEVNATGYRQKPPSFRVRGLLVFLAIFGLCLGWLVRSARIQHGEIAEIERGHGTVWYAFEWSDGSPYFGQPPQWRAWLHREIGTDFFSRVTKVDLNELSASDALLAHVEAFSDIEELQARCGGHTHKRISDAGLKCLSKLYKLTRLSLGGSDITDAGLVHLLSLSNLKDLDLSDTPISDEGLTHLRGAKQLLRLNLRRTRVTDAGVRSLEQALPLVLVER